MRTILCVVLLTTGLVGCAQCERLGQLDTRWERIWPNYMEASYGYEDSVLAFKEAVMAYLRDGVSWNCSTNDTSRLRSVWAPDSAFRVLSWDEVTGGSYHDMAAIVQQPARNGTCSVLVLDPWVPDAVEAQHSMENVSVYRVDKLTDVQPPTYLLFGWGTHGGGHQHQTIQVFRSTPDGIERCMDCFTDDRSYSVEYPCADTVDLTFDARTNTISHSGFRDSTGEGEVDGFKHATGKRVRLVWSGDRFIIKPE